MAQGCSPNCEGGKRGSHVGGRCDQSHDGRVQLTTPWQPRCWLNILLLAQHPAGQGNSGPYGASHEACVVPAGALHQLVAPTGALHQLVAPGAWAMHDKWQGMHGPCMTSDGMLRMRCQLQLGWHGRGRHQGTATHEIGQQIAGVTLSTTAAAQAAGGVPRPAWVPGVKVPSCRSG